MSTLPSEGLPPPWRSYGWALWAVWLVFLVFPVLASLEAPNTPLRLLGLVATAVFAILYVIGFTGLTSGVRHRGVPPPAAALAAMVVVGALGLPALGLGVLSFAPYLQSLGAFALDRPLSWWWSGGVAAAALLAPWLLDPSPGWFFLSFIVIAVGVGTGAGRLMADQGAHQALLREELTVTAERDRVARDVHDVLGHSLTVVAVKAELAERLVEVDPARARAELRDVQRLTRQALTEVRATVGGLRLARLEVELDSAEQALRAAGIASEVVGTPDVLESLHRPVAAWALREAVTNVVRHSGARRCCVEVLPSGLRVSDDGGGRTGERARDGNGLRGLRERVDASGGRLAVGARPGGGTLVEVIW